ncbi:hypothetical protein BU17DRAFT_72199 [Hysterangium stoloniferum]|nr:hypothetical protein BU17DRAFT_72199 [Hysterangium stoloniferum]
MSTTTFPGLEATQTDAPNVYHRVPSESFSERQIVHFAMVLGRKWACGLPGHEMCFISLERHIKLTDDHIMRWVTALCNGEATTAHPPFALGDNANDFSLSLSLENPPTYSHATTSSPSLSTNPGGDIPLIHQETSLSPLLRSRDLSLEQQNTPSVSRSPSLSRNNSKNQRTSPKSNQYPLILQHPLSPRISTMSSFSTDSLSSFHSAATSLGLRRRGSVDTDSRASSIMTDSGTNSLLLESKFSVVGSWPRERTSSLDGAGVGDRRDVAVDTRFEAQSRVGLGPLSTLVESRAGSETEIMTKDADTVADREFNALAKESVSGSTTSIPRPHTADILLSSSTATSYPNSRPRTADVLYSRPQTADSIAFTLRDSLSYSPSRLGPRPILAFAPRPTAPVYKRAANDSSSMLGQNQFQNQPHPTPILVPGAAPTHTDDQPSQQCSAATPTPTTAFTPRQTHTPRTMSVSSNTTTNTMGTSASDSSGQLLNIAAFPDPPTYTPVTPRNEGFVSSLTAGGPGGSNPPNILPRPARDQAQRRAESGEGHWENQPSSNQNHSQLPYGSGSDGSVVSGSQYSQTSMLSEDGSPISQEQPSPNSFGTTNSSSHGSSDARPLSSGISVLVLAQNPPLNPPSGLVRSSTLPSIISHTSHFSITSHTSPTATSPKFTATKQPVNKSRKDASVALAGPPPKRDFPLSSRKFWEGTAGPGLALAEEFRLNVVARRRAAQSVANSAEGGKGKEKEKLTHANSNGLFNTRLNDSIVASLQARLPSLPDSVPIGGPASPSDLSLALADGYYSTTNPEEARNGGGNLGRTMGSSSGSTSSIPRAIVSNEWGVSNPNAANPMFISASSSSHPNPLNKSPARSPLLHDAAIYTTSTTIPTTSQNARFTTTITDPNPAFHSAPPDHDRTGADSPYLTSFEGSMTDLTHDHGERSVWSPYTTFLPSLSTSQQQSADTAKTNWMESAALSKRAKAHLARLKKWRKRANETLLEGKKGKGKEGESVSDVEREGAVKMMGDAIEMARACYPPRVHKLAYEIGRELQQWLQAFTESDADLLKNQQNVMLAIVIQTCIIPILLTRISEVDPSVLPLASDLINSLTRVPLALHDNEVPLFHVTPANPPQRSRSHIISRDNQSATNSVPPLDRLMSPRSSATSTSAIAIHLVSRELALVKPTCERQHSWLGLYLLRIVEWTMKMRVLSRGEVDAVRGMMRRREMEYGIPADSSGSMPSRSWEVALFALCASQTPVFKTVVLGPIGLPLMVSALNDMLRMDIDMDGVKWEDVALNLRAMAFLSEHGWVVVGVEEDCEVLITSIMGVFRRTIPSRWFSIRFWAMDTIRNIVSHRPPLVRILVAQDVAAAFATLTPSSPSYPQLIGSRGLNIQSKSRPRIMDEYRKEAAKRAEEMVLNTSIQIVMDTKSGFHIGIPYPARKK